MEYWDLEQAKLKKSGSSPAFAGEVALVTGGTKFEVIPSPRFVLSKAFGRATTL